MNQTLLVRYRRSNAPDGVSLADYLSLVVAVGKRDNALMGLDHCHALRGSWETLCQLVASVWSEVTRSFTSVANNLLSKGAVTLVRWRKTASR